MEEKNNEKENTDKKLLQKTKNWKKQKKHKKIRWVEKELWAKLQELNQNFAKIKEPKKLYNKKWKALLWTSYLFLTLAYGCKY